MTTLHPEEARNRVTIFTTSGNTQSKGTHLVYKIFPGSRLLCFKFTALHLVALFLTSFLP